MTEGGGRVTSGDLWLGCWEELKEMGAAAMLTWSDILLPARLPLFPVVVMSRSQHFRVTFTGTLPQCGHHMRGWPSHVLTVGKGE